MRILYVVQRYGEEVAGGAEQHCREFAERLVVRGHDVDVLTTCAVSYVDWDNAYPPGRTKLNGVTVHRVPVAFPRHARQFDLLNARTLHGKRPRALEMQREWMRIQGPYAPEIPSWLRRNARSYDCVVFVTYLYWTAWAGLQAVAGAVPTILHPTAHDEPPLRLSLFDEVFRLPDAFAFLTEEEAKLVERRFPGAPRGDVIGIGVELDTVADSSRFGLGTNRPTSPYLCYVGRVDPAKGAAELLDFFVAHKQQHPSDLALVLVGEPVMQIPERPDVVTTGFVEREIRDAAIAGALALVQPSYFESFSMVLTEAFAHRRPALVQQRCAVLAGHARRSGAAIPYSGFAEFDAAVELLHERPELADTLGARGRAYVEREYRWERVLDRYERLLGAVAAGSRPRLAGLVS
jgi:glycosyltransferase involved in cell wall biosynthesis